MLSWSKGLPAGKGLTSWLLLVMFIVFFVTFPCGILGQVWYLIVSFPDLCCLSYFEAGSFGDINEKHMKLTLICIGTIQKVST